MDVASFARKVKPGEPFARDFMPTVQPTITKSLLNDTEPPAKQGLQGMKTPVVIWSTNPYKMGFGLDKTGASL